ncbi:COesterase domain-containing protein [Mycena venus]|uniref:Carboxylic ester hydrolase n=1 Tax=Mycena venus TaxID=2733690 RepID=A0A8H6X6V0_9AGAR|nr:COesterase domain-containing protein [Mycena venus]
MVSLHLAASALLTAALASAQTPPVVDVGYAQYQGFVDTATNITQFLGIRYAAPPIGDLRFRAPQHPANETGLQLATFQPNWCMQSGDGTSPTNPLRKREAAQAPEDCLFLNVYYPSDAVGTPPRGLLPTLVWIHGGGYIAGAAIGASGEDVVRQGNRGIVVVVIQYRLGIAVPFEHDLTSEMFVGFLAGSAVKKNGNLNAGLLDQEFALRWVNQHISKFGGDPSKVTIWGQSAGAGSVLQHVIANGGKTKPQLFRGAITSSTFLPPQYNYDDYVPEASYYPWGEMFSVLNTSFQWIFKQVVAQTNCTSAMDAMVCLRAVDPAVLSTVNSNINNAGFYGTFLTTPVVDGEFITQRPTLSLLKGKVNGQALLSITNPNEGVDFVNQNVSTTAAQYAYDLFPNFGTIQAEIAGALYKGVGSNLDQVNKIQGECANQDISSAIFICPTANSPSRPACTATTYPYYWPNGVAPPFNNTAFINAFAQSFTSFIVNLDPNKKLNPTILPPWSKYDILTGNTAELVFNKTTSDQPDIRPLKTDGKLLERCLFWESVGSLIGQ